MLKQLILFLGIPYLFLTCGVEAPSVPLITAYKLNDSLKIDYRGEGDMVTCRLFDRQASMEKIGDGHFQLIVPVVALDSSVFGFYIKSYRLNADNKSELIASHSHEWKGTHIKAFVENNQLRGSYLTDSLYDTSTKKNRNYSMYLPSLSETKLDTINVVIMTDGESMPRYYKYVDALNHQKQIQPLALFGLHSTKGKSDQHSIRYLEYVFRNDNNPYFINHETFFLETFIPFIERTVEPYCNHISFSLYGYSNGGAFCNYLGLNYPERFEYVTTFSTAGYISSFSERKEYYFAEYPNFYLGAGKYEYGILEDNQFFCEELESNNVRYEFNEFNSGHDYVTWRYQFLNFLEKIF